MMTRPLGDMNKIETLYTGIGLTIFGLLMLLWAVVDMMIITPLAWTLRLIRKIKIKAQSR